MLDAAPPPHVETINLMNSKKSDELGGTVCAIHEYLSARFLAYYVVDHDASCKYMVDIRPGHKKDRKIRVSSTKHVNTKPIWVQFGETSDVYLYFSQKASVAEEAWLWVTTYSFQQHLHKDIVSLGSCASCPAGVGQ
jgi:hypothetical protein